MRSANPELTAYISELPWKAQPRGTMSELARKCGVAEATVYKWQMGMTAPSSRYWGHIEATFDLPPGTIAEKATATPAELSRAQRQNLIDMANDAEQQARRLTETIGELRRQITATV